MDNTKELLEQMVEDVRIAQGNTDAAIEDYNDALELVALLEAENAKLVENAEFYRKMAGEKMSQAAELNLELVQSQAEIADLKEMVTLMNGAYDQAIDLATTLKAENEILKEELAWRKK